MVDARTQAPKSLKPLLRWAGGKSLLLQRLEPFLPEDIGRRVYREPFLGAASLFLHVAPNRAVISDLNRHLIDCYRSVRDNPRAVWRNMRGHFQRDSSDYYYRVRNIYNQSRRSHAQAARFIYLNRTCFNGIFRVNQSGQFNVPYAYKNLPAFPRLAELISVGQALAKAQIRSETFVTALDAAKRGDFIYLDPPYPPLNGTSYFTHYTMDRFNDQDQEKLADVVRALDRRRCLVMLTNANTPRIRQLYKGFRIKTLNVTRFVTCKSHKHRVREAVICNY
jgi:DNA adenine methylase